MYLGDGGKRKRHRLRSAYRWRANWLQNIVAKGNIYRVWKYGDILASCFWDMAQNSFGDPEAL